MPSLNDVTIIGHMGRDPEVRYTPSGAAVTAFSVATSENWKDKSGEWQEATEWHTIEVWGPAGERFAEKARKGDLASVKGMIKTDSWEKDGVKQYKTKIKAFKVLQLSGYDREPRQQAETHHKEQMENDLPF